MSTVQLKLGPADAGRPLTLDDYESAEFHPGYKYELIDGRLYVSPVPNFPEAFLETWLRRKLEDYSDTHPKLIGFITPKGKVHVLKRRRPTMPEPDLAVYASIPQDITLRKIRWKDLKPFLVIEVLVDGEFEKDFHRNPILYDLVPSIQEYWVLNGSDDPDEPSLVQYRRSETGWLIKTFPYRSTFTTKLLPGFQLVIDPRK